MTDSPLLEGVSPQECQAMRACLGVYEQYFRPGDIVYDLGGGRNMLGVLTDGAAVIERVDGKGERTILEHLEPGGVFGEMMMFRSAVDNSVMVRCAAPCCVSFLRSEAVLRRCEHACACHSRLVENLFRLVTDKATSLSERVEVLSRRSIRDKLLCYFSLQQAKNGGSFTLPFSLSALADYISTDRSAMMRELKKLREGGVVQIEGRKVTILAEDIAP